MHVQNIQDWMQYEVSIFKQYRASNLKVEITNLLIKYTSTISNM
jgi:hypothetical protein